MSYKTHRASRRTPERCRRAIASGCLAAVVALVAVMSVAVPTAAGAAEPATLHVSDTTELDPQGATVTVTGSGFNPAANVGTRPPFAGQPSGVYVAFGRFGEPWKPSEQASSSSRQIITQVWVLPKAAHDILDPTGSNPEVALMEPDGSFVAELDVKVTDGTGSYGMAAYPGSGAVNPDQEVLVPISFAAAETTTSTTTAPTATTSTTSTTTAPTATTTTPTTTAPTSTTTTPTTTTVRTEPSGTRYSRGVNGQTLEVTPADDLDPAGQTLTVSGTGYDPTLGVYVGLCVDKGPQVAPSPCVGGVDMESTGSSSAWVSSAPPDYAQNLVTPFDESGSFDVTLTVAASDEFVDCLDGSTQCVIATRADHTAGENRAGDVKVAVYFQGQTPGTEDAAAPGAAEGFAGYPIVPSPSGAIPTAQPGGTAAGTGVSSNGAPGPAALAYTGPAVAVGPFVAAALMLLAGGLLLVFSPKLSSPSAVGTRIVAWTNDNRTNRNRADNRANDKATNHNRDGAGR